jgi:hypothetical protein
MNKSELIEEAKKEIEKCSCDVKRHNLVNFLKLCKKTKVLSDYELQAKFFLLKSDTTLKIEFLKNGKYFDDDKDKRNIYQCILSKNGEVYSFTFGDSINNTQKGIKPSVYDILACVEKYQYDNFKDFCNAFGYDEDSRKAYKIYEAVKEQGENIISLFGEDDTINDLREIV